MPSPRSSEPVIGLVETPLGTARILRHEAERAVATLVLGHGAGRGSDTDDLVTLAGQLPSSGITVVRVDQPWVVAGRRVAPAPASLDRCWLAIVSSLPVAGALLLGGRSAGARVACRTAGELGAAGVLALAFPLHPPGRPDRSRVDELLGAGVPTLVVQGERDAFGRPDEFPEGPAVIAVPGADHSLRIGRRPAVLPVADIVAWCRAQRAAAASAYPVDTTGNR